eukprot:TRINITY_DN16833_c0_g1_i1.p1 TRINITY_DN16833_c0_g1~~TRINITY_DN16833_c0_g1_i1.p1  ORF type:complete len:547 (-),score=101.31 TRINITY_DN16833_c0_g1_i1:111-1751(-)
MAFSKGVVAKVCPIALLGETPLIAAVRSGHHAEVMRLLMSGADPDEPDAFGETALMEAAASGAVDLCEALLLYGADPERKAPSGLALSELVRENAALETLFSGLAAWSAAQVLIWAGSHDCHRLQLALRCCERHGVLGNGIASPHSTLEQAAADASTRAATSVSLDGTTALHACAARKSSPGGLESVRLLLQAQAAIDARNLLGETPLLLAVRAAAAQRSECDESAGDERRLALVRCLIDSRADVDQADALLRETPLMEAACCTDRALCTLLLDCNADVSRRSAAGLSALSFALEAQRSRPDAAGAASTSTVLTAESQGDEAQLRSLLLAAVAGGTPATVLPRAAKDTPLAGSAAVNHVKADSGCAGAGRSGGAHPAVRRGSDRDATVTTAQPRSAPAERASGASSEVPRPLRHERILRILAKYPGFKDAGVQLPPDCDRWTDQDLELFVGSLGELWPPGRRRSSGDDARIAEAGLPQGPLRQHLNELGLTEQSVTSDPRGMLKTAYRRAALRWHPDKNKDPHAPARFNAALDAYHRLCWHFGVLG